MVDTADNGEIPDNLTDHDECRVHSPQYYSRGKQTWDTGNTAGQLLRELSKYCAQLLL